MELGILARILESAIARMGQQLLDVSDFATRELIKSKEEVQIKGEKVQAKIVEIK
jgi:hypothetical protein